MIENLYFSKNFLFSKGAGELNIFGIRTGQAATNKFDDFLGVAYASEPEMEPRVLLWPATTDPGFPYLRKPINPHGCAILAEGQYVNAYQIGKHMGKYSALVQSGGKVRVYRDNDKNNNYNYDPKSIESGKFGINIHKRSGETEFVNGSSAGCQVFRYAKDFEELMKLCKDWRSRTKENKFSYTLFLVEDFDQSLKIE